MNSGRHPKAEVRWHLYDLRMLSKQSNQNIEALARPVIQSLGSVHDSTFEGGFETLRILWEFWTKDSENEKSPDARLEELFVAYPFLRQWKSFHESFPNITEELESSDLDDPGIFYTEQFASEKNDELFEAWHEAHFEDIWLQDEQDHLSKISRAAEAAVNNYESSIAYLLKVREISSLIHFTPTGNLQSIANLGLIPRRELVDQKIHFNPTDDKRLDSLYNTVSLSITIPNLKMMHSKRGRGPFCVLEIDPTILTHLPFVAFPTNAARSECTKLLYEEIEIFIGHRGLNRMFLNGLTKFKTTPKPGRIEIDREALGLATNLTTDPQAEIMVLKPIPKSAIKRIHTTFPFDENQRSLNKIFEAFPRKMWHFNCSEYFPTPELSDDRERTIDPNTIRDFDDDY